MQSPQGQEILSLECQIEGLSQQQRRHADLIRMAQTPLPASLKEAVILISSEPCPDCLAFTKKVNKHFGLFIQLFAAVAKAESPT